MTLTTEEIILVGALADNQGFQCLLKSLQNLEDTYLLTLEIASTDEEERRITARWRAYRHVLAQLRTTTLAFKEYADAAVNGLNPEVPDFNTLE